jgi:hypothetical protein
MANVPAGQPAAIRGRTEFGTGFARRRRYAFRPRTRTGNPYSNEYFSLFEPPAQPPRLPGMHETANVDGRVRTESVDAGQPDGPQAIPDSEARPRVADTDEAAASEARIRYREHGVEPLEPDERIRTQLAPGEQVIAVRRFVALDRRQTSAEAPAIDSLRGDLYVTSARLVHVGPRILTFELDDIEDAALAGERVLLLLRDGLSVAIEADRPRLLRVQVAAARAARAGPTGRRPRGPQPASR